MRRAILFGSLLLGTLQIKGQCTLPYLPIEKFDNDVTAFTMYNFRDRGDCYDLKTFRDFMDDLGIRIDHFKIKISNKDHQYVDGISIFFYSEKELKRRLRNKREINSISVYFDDPIPIKELPNSTDIKTTNNWNITYHHYFFNKVLLETRTDVYTNSKYYKKYIK